MTKSFTPHDPLYADRVRSSFDRQGAMKLFDATLAKVEPGLVEIEVPFSEKVSQQHGYIHGGVISALCDSAAGYAAYSLFAPEDSILTVEFKINFLAAADCDRLRAIGRVVKSGRTLTICEMSAIAFKGDRETVCVHGLATMMCVLPTAKRSPG
jgi:uncharacterized protein (TIGR00369 family)